MDVQELVRVFGVSQRTIRRDLAWLAERDLVRRGHGRAAAGNGPLRPPPAVDRVEARAATERMLPIHLRARTRQAEKEAIGAAAAALVPADAHVILDSGTTTLQVARHLAGRLRGTVITNGLMIAWELCPHPDVRLVLTGGHCRPETLPLVGPRAWQALEGVHADLAFLGATGVSLEHGLTTSDLLEAEVKKAMLRAARTVVLVADSTKFGKVSLYRFGELRDVDRIVTDGGLPPDLAQRIGALGIDLLVAKGEVPPPPNSLEEALGTARREAHP